MASGITKTVPHTAGRDFLDSLYDGRLHEFEFHKSGGAGKLRVGDYVYTIFENELVGRLRVTRLVEGAVNPESGQPRTLIYVACPGERLAAPVPHQGHRGTRYYDGADWPAG